MRGLVVHWQDGRTVLHLMEKGKGEEKLLTNVLR